MKKTVIIPITAALIFGAYILGAETTANTKDFRDRTFKCMIASQPYEYMFLNQSDPKTETISLYGIEFGTYTGGTQGALFYSGFMQCLHEMSSNTTGKRLPWGSYEPLQLHSGIAPLLKKEPFASVNPAILNWGVRQFLPAPNEKLDGVSYQKIYNVVLQRAARLMTESYLYIRYKRQFEYEQAHYMQVVMQAKYADMDQYLAQRYSGILSEYRMSHQEWGILQPHHAIGFWLRRGLDKSDVTLWQMLATTIQQYDRDWFEKTVKGYPVKAQ